LHSTPSSLNGKRAPCQLLSPPSSLGNLITRSCKDRCSKDLRSTDQKTIPGQTEKTKFTIRPPCFGLFCVGFFVFVCVYRKKKKSKKKKGGKKTPPPSEGAQFQFGLTVKDHVWFFIFLVLVPLKICPE
jgi:hypothetical protein